VLAAFAWRVHGLVWQSLWRDEVDAIHFATRELAATLAMFTSPGQNGPLYFLALRPWFVLVGTSEFALRYPSVWGGVLAVALTWQIARRLLPLTPETPTHLPAWGASVLLAANPYQLWYAQEGKMYTLLTALVLLAHWWWLEGIHVGGWRPWLAYWLTLTVGLYVHLLTILVLPLHLLWFALAWPQSRTHGRGLALALGGLTLPYVPMVWWQWRMLMATVKLTGFTFTPPLAMIRTLALNHGRGFLPPGDLVWAAPIVFLAAAGALLGVGEIAASREPAVRAISLAAWRRYALVLTWVVAPVAGIYALSLRQPIFTDRYVIWIAPALAMLVALGAATVWRYAWRLGPPLAVGLLVYVTAYWLLAGWQQKVTPTKYDLRSGVSYVTARRAPEDLLILQIPHLEWAYRYYSSDFGPRPFADSDARLGAWRPGLWTNQDQPDDAARAEVDRHMRTMTAGYDVVWLLRSEVEMWDRRRLMDEWLDRHGVVTDQADFLGVQVRAYRLRL
jgi:uncharacterized membrane protein